ncbi:MULTISPECIES: MerR family transcriptional regulator [unclassified Streptomyces]|uniref:MerR family transcriptional regulator n=1 Tax=Streptomyces sp. NPDC127129 TaxID=3345373 RepID=UPI00363958B6
MATYRISQLAERSGVPATTLRFYETAGLLPAERTASGYRVYDDAAVDRLAFITSAKHLGLALDEIRELLDVREEGVCASVRARLLPLVTSRIRDTDGRVADLRAFSDRLTGVRTALSGPAPPGACDPDCGCTPAGQPESPRHEARRHTPVACTLDGPALTERTTQWRALATEADHRERTDEGVRLSFPPREGLAARIADLAAAEQNCCPFLDFTLHLTPPSLHLTVRAPEGAAGMLSELFGGRP